MHPLSVVHVHVVHYVYVHNIIVTQTLYLYKKPTLYVFFCTIISKQSYNCCVQCTVYVFVLDKVFNCVHVDLVHHLSVLLHGNPVCVVDPL